MLCIIWKKYLFMPSALRKDENFGGKAIREAAAGGLPALFQGSRPPFQRRNGGDPPPLLLLRRNLIHILNILYIKLETR
jgi:hypothetical protein